LVQEKYIVSEITVLTYYPLQNNIHWSYTLLHTNFPGLEASHEVTLWECFKWLCHLLHTCHITHWRFCWQFLSFS